MVLRDALRELGYASPCKTYAGATVPDRPRSHVLAGEGVRKFAGAIEPTLAFYERPQPEYGIDGDVEEFDPTGRTTGLHFFVQVKSTDTEKLAEALAVPVEIGTANYFRAASMPVLMVRYHAPTDSLYVKWFHQYDSYYGRGGEKTLTFRWAPEDIWKTDSAAHLAADARAYYAFQRASLELPLPLHLVTNGTPVVTSSEVRIALRAVARERADIVALGTGDPPAGTAWIELTEQEVRVNLAKVTAATLHLSDGDYQGEGAAERIAVDALTLLALAFERVGQAAIAARLAATYLPRSTLVRNVEAASALSSAMARAHRIREALALAESLDNPDDEELSTVAFVFGLAVLQAGQSASEDELEVYADVLKQRIKRRKRSHPVDAGRASMNLAAFHRGQARFDQAVSYYEQAAKLDPEYKERAHYWYEYGGALWGTRQFARSAEAYQHAIDRGTSEPLVIALRADSLMFAGRYAEALELFELFHEPEASEDDGEYRLKARAMTEIMSRLGLEHQRRSTGRVMRVGEGIEPETAEEWVEVSLRQLQEDALGGSAWLNLGVAEDAAGRREAALECHIASTILMPEDHEAWCNAIFTALAVGDVEALRDLLVSGRRLGGDELIARVVQRSAELGKDFPRESFLQVVDEILEEHEAVPKPGVKLHMLSEGGAVEEMILGGDAPPPDSEA